MSLSIYAASVPLFQQMLGSLKDVLAKAEATLLPAISSRRRCWRRGSRRTCFR